MPLKWAVLEENIPNELRGMVDFLPRVEEAQMIKGVDQSYMWATPVFSPAPNTDARR
jgi:hypothetical protein